MSGVKCSSNLSHILKSFLKIFLAFCLVIASGYKRNIKKNKNNLLKIWLSIFLYG